MKTRKRLPFTIIIGAVLAALLIIAVALAPLIAPNNPTRVNMALAHEGPSEQFPLGTDQLGRCVLSRLLYGGRTSLGVTCLVLLITLLIGTVIGTVSGLFAGRWPDKFLTAVCEVVLAFPGLVLALVISGLLGPGILKVMLAIALVSWAKYARVVRSLVIGIRKADYMKAARVAGASTFRLVTRHILPNIGGALGTLVVTDLGSTILRFAGLSFIGLGAQPPKPEWGMMINDARLHINSNPMLIIYPILAVTLSVLAFHLLSDGLRDRLDSKA
ncbi:MAG TPA: ABC transporter permease [Clostridiales bacterium]|jgi:peptide/nickel transport system permease protein|nr:ABC transporter permease [Clostridiales bacterium]